LLSSQRSDGILLLLSNRMISVPVTKVDFKSLAKRDFRDFQFPLQELSFILAADVIYDDEITAVFVDALVAVLEKSSSECVAFVSVDHRVNFRLSDLSIGAHARDFFVNLLKSTHLFWISEIWDERNFPRDSFYLQMKSSIYVSQKKKEQKEQGGGGSESGRCFELFTIKRNL